MAEGALSALHTEMVLYFVNAHLQREKLSQQQQDAVYDPLVAANASPQSSASPTNTSQQEGSGVDGTASPSSVGIDPATFPIAPLRPTPPAFISATLESMGFNAGARIIERQLMAEHRLLHMTPTDAMKFVAGPLWKAVFAKKIDRLKGSHHSFNMWDLNFKWIKANSFHRAQFSENASVAKTIEHAPGSQAGAPGGGPSKDGNVATQHHDEGQGQQKSSSKSIEAGGPKDYLYFIVGVIRGALDTMGFSKTHVTVVTPAPTTPSQVEFKVVFAREQRLE